MKTILTNLAIEFGPVAAFFLVYSFYDFFSAIWAAITASVLAVSFALYRQRRFAWFPVSATASMLFFGGSSLYFQNETFYILQDSIGSVLFSSILLGSVWLWKRPILESWFGHSFAISKTGWRTITIRWGVFFLVMAAANEFVRLTLTPDTWVLFKAGMLAATTLFGLYQFRISMKERIAGESNALGLRVVPIPIDERE